MRVVLALYLAFALPWCCCRMSAAAACCESADPPDATASRTVDAHVREGHHHDHGDHHHQHGDQAPESDQAPSPTGPSDHDDSCDCGCEAVGSLLLEKSVTIDYPVLTVAAVTWVASLAPLYRPSVRPLAARATGPPTSLVRMHCALII